MLSICIPVQRQKTTTASCSTLHAHADEAQVADVGADDATRHACCRFGRQMGISAQPLHCEAARALPVLCRKQVDAGAYTALVRQAGRTTQLQAEHLSWHRPLSSESWAHHVSVPCIYSQQCLSNLRISPSAAVGLTLVPYRSRASACWPATPLHHSTCCLSHWHGRSKSPASLPAAGCSYCLEQAYAEQHIASSRYGAGYGAARKAPRSAATEGKQTVQPAGCGTQHGRPAKGKVGTYSDVRRSLHVSSSLLSTACSFVSRVKATSRYAKPVNGSRATNDLSIATSYLHAGVRSSA